MPVETDLLNIYANGLERVLEANLTNLFGISNDHFLSFKQDKKSATHSSVTEGRQKKTMQKRMVNKPTWIPISTMNSFMEQYTSELNNIDNLVTFKLNALLLGRINSSNNYTSYTILLT